MLYSLLVQRLSQSQSRTPDFRLADGKGEAVAMSSPEIVVLDGQTRYFRAAVLKARGYSVFATEHVVEVCLRWVPGGCAALVIGPQIPWEHVATLCDWIKINSPEKPVILLSDRRNARWPANVDAVVPTQPVQLLIERLRSMLSVAGEQNGGLKPAAVGNSGAVGASSRLRKL